LGHCIATFFGAQPEIRSVRYAIPLLPKKYLEHPYHIIVWQKTKMNTTNRNYNTIQRLLLNEVNVTENLILHLAELDRASVQECVAALRQNTSFKQLNLFDNFILGPPAGAMEETDRWDPFWNAISNHSVLEDVLLFFGGPLQSNRFLVAIAQSSSIQKAVLFKSVVNAQSLSTFFRTITSVRHLIWSCPTFDGTLNPDEAEYLSASMAENSSMEVLECWNLEPLSLTVVMRGLLKMKYLRTYIDIRPKDTDFLTYKARLLPALKRNSSLWLVTTVINPNVWSKAENFKMAFYAKRNKTIHALLATPKDSVQQQLLTARPPVTAWPRFFRAVQGCEVEASVIFSVLTALGDSVGRLPTDAKERKSEGPHVEDTNGSGP
jgi:hypothetical protein